MAGFPCAIKQTGSGSSPEAEVETLAGYDVLTRQTSPATSFLRAARKDLVAEYEALKQPEKAVKYRAELAANEAKLPGTTRKNRSLSG